MPLIKSGTKSALKQNISTLMNDVGRSPHVKSPAQALAIAYDTQRRNRAAGGPVGIANAGEGFAMGGGPSYMPPVPPVRKDVTKGPLMSAVPGRTDAHQTHVPSGSYVVPADIVSGKGQGNTMAGFQSLQKLFRMGPYGGPAASGSKPRALMRGKGMPRVGNTKFAKGGTPDPHTGKPVRVNLAGGELVIPPENLMDVVHPDLKHAHKIMDAWVLHERKKLRKTLAKLPGPVKS